MPSDLYDAIRDRVAQAFDSLTIHADLSEDGRLELDSLDLATIATNAALDVLSERGGHDG